MDKCYFSEERIREKIREALRKSKNDKEIEENIIKVLRGDG
jgi:hypothetical protein